MERELGQRAPELDPRVAPGRDGPSDRTRLPPGCQFGGRPQTECRPLWACDGQGSPTTFYVDAYYRVDEPPPAPAYPNRYHSQPVDVGGDFDFYEDGASAGVRVHQFVQQVRYLGQGVPVHTESFSFSSTRGGQLTMGLRVGTPRGVMIHSTSIECVLTQCVA